LAGDLSAVPRDVDYVLHFAVTKRDASRFDDDLAANAEGAGRLLARCRDARAFLHCSSAAVYQAKGGEPVAESDPLGDHHRRMLPTYSLSKIAAEAVVRFAARESGVPTTIARLGVPYGAAGGWPFVHLVMMKQGIQIPVHPSGRNRFPLLHEDDYVGHVEGLLGAASVPATVVNWAGSEDTCIEDWCAWLGELTGLEPKLEASEAALEPLPLDLTRMHALLGPTRVPWREGIRRMVEARAPELLRDPPG
ncbi:MAG: NAD(P)-dependent oxidoreductase, partial [Myxococcota bacterium]|nr:NAD(P)-dependent oxidoreductase [Myxococcota bacterium]